MRSWGIVSLCMGLSMLLGGIIFGLALLCNCDIGRARVIALNTTLYVDICVVFICLGAYHLSEVIEEKIEGMERGK